MQAARLCTEIAPAHSGPEVAGEGREGDVDGLAGFPATVVAAEAGAAGKPEQLTFDFGDEMSLFTRLLLRDPPAASAAGCPSIADRPAKVEGVTVAVKAAARHDVSDQEIRGLAQVTRWGR